MAADLVNTELIAKGHTVTIKTAGEITPDILGSQDVTVLATPSWDFDGLEGQPHEDFVKLFKACEGKTTPGKKYAVFGLGDSSYTHFCGGVDHLVNFVKSLQGELVTDALKIDGFFYNQQKNTETIKQWAQTLASKLV